MFETTVLLKFVLVKLQFMNNPHIQPTVIIKFMLAKLQFTNNCIVKHENNGQIISM